MQTQKPERPRCSNLTEQQWKNIIEQFEYEWDMEFGNNQWPKFKDTLRREHKRDIETLAALSLICPAEVEILVEYDTECQTEFIDKMDAFFKALADRVDFALKEQEQEEEENK